jgi:hypothetical protein
MKWETHETGLVSRLQLEAKTRRYVVAPVRQGWDLSHNHSPLLLLRVRRHFRRLMWAVSLASLSVSLLLQVSGHVAVEVVFAAVPLTVPS